MFQKVNIAVVTAITGGRDGLLPQVEYEGVQYVAFLDEPEYTHPWEVRKAYAKFKDPVMNAKIHKMLTHKYIDNPYIVWMDGNRTLKQDPHELVDMMGDKDFGFFNHYDRTCIYKEIRTCLSVKRGNPDELQGQREDYLASGFPHNSAMIDGGAFIRKNNEKANTLMERWWAEVCRYSNRDQVAFPKVFAGQEWATIPGKIFRGDNEFFTYTRHL